VRLHPSIPMLRIVPDDTKFDFMRFRRISFPVSAVLSILRLRCISSMASISASISSAAP
jgi:hypothetical protein